MSRKPLTPSQTVGPYFSLGLDWKTADCLVDDATPGQHIVVQGRVFDADGEAVPDALLEIWQADATGHYHGEAGAAFRGSGRTAVDAEGRYRFATIKPGPVTDGGAVQAPHINLAVFARGLLVHLNTRIYFADEVAANASDRVLARVPAARRQTVIASRAGDHYTFDIRLRGAHETVFFQF